MYILQVSKRVGLAYGRVVGHLRGTRLNSDFIFCSVCSVVTFSAVLDSSEHAESGKNCLGKLSGKII